MNLQTTSRVRTVQVWTRRVLVEVEPFNVETEMSTSPV